MTTLSIEDLKAWLELLPKLPAGPWGWRGKSSSLHTVGGSWPYGETVLAPTYDYDEGVGIESAEGVSEHLKKCDPATIAALIEGYIAMAEAIEKARIALAAYACHSGETCARTPEQCRDWCGKAAGDAILIVDAALNIGGTND